VAVREESGIGPVFEDPRPGHCVENQAKS